MTALSQFVPEPIAEELASGDGTLEPVEAKPTVLFCDIEGFTAITDELGPRRVFEFLNAYFDVVAEIIERHAGIVTQFQGDAVLAAFNVPVPDPDHAAHALRAAIALARASERQKFAGVELRCRVGLCTGRVIAGAVGSRGRLSYTVHGNRVNRAARLEKLNERYGTRILFLWQDRGALPGHPAAASGGGRDSLLRGAGRALYRRLNHLTQRGIP